MFKNIVLLMAAIIPITILLKFVFDKDTIEKEPLLLLLKLFVSGMFSCLLVLFVSNALREYIHIDNLFYNSFVEIAFIEEICKWICIYIITWRNKEFNYRFDAIVYCIYVSLGFALIENIGYAFQYGIATCLIRAVISVPGHAFFAIYMGYYLGMAKMAYINFENREGATFTLSSIFVPTFLHGIYNYCLLGGNDGFYIVFFLFIITLYFMAFKTVNDSSSMDVAFENSIS